MVTLRLAYVFALAEPPRNGAQDLFQNLQWPIQFVCGCGGRSLWFLFPASLSIFKTRILFPFLCYLIFNLAPHQTSFQQSACTNISLSSAHQCIVSMSLGVRHWDGTADKLAPPLNEQLQLWSMKLGVTQDGREIISFKFYEVLWRGAGKRFFVLFSDICIPR